MATNTKSHLPLIVLAVIILAIVALRPLKILHQESAGMEPCVKQGEIIVVNAMAYHYSLPQRWDVIAFSPPVNDSRIWCSRVVGLPGDNIDFQSEGLLVNGKPITRPGESVPVGLKAASQSNLAYESKCSVPEVRFPYKVPANSYFTLGDNADNSLDGRFWGALRVGNIVGKVIGK